MVAVTYINIHILGDVMIYGLPTKPFTDKQQNTQSKDNAGPLDLCVGNAIMGKLLNIYGLVYLVVIRYIYGVVENGSCYGWMM